MFENRKMQLLYNLTRVILVLTVFHIVFEIKNPKNLNIHILKFLLNCLPIALSK